MVLLHGIWLRRIGDRVEVLVELYPGRWHIIIEEQADAPFSHIVEASGIAKAAPVPSENTVRDETVRVHHMVAHNAT